MDSGAGAKTGPTKELVEADTKLGKEDVSGSACFFAVDIVHTKRREF